MGTWEISNINQKHQETKSGILWYTMRQYDYCRADWLNRNILKLFWRKTPNTVMKLFVKSNWMVKVVKRFTERMRKDIAALPDYIFLHYFYKIHHSHRYWFFLNGSHTDSNWVKYIFQQKIKVDYELLPRKFCWGGAEKKSVCDKLSW